MGKNHIMAPQPWHTSVAEVAEIMAAPEKTVKTRMFHARKRLGELLAGHGIYTFAAA